MNLEHLPLADAGREEEARRLFLSGVSPEEYAARFGHEWACFSFDDYRYVHPGLTEWVQRLGDILFHRNGAPTLRQLREKYLTPEQIGAAEARERDSL